MAKCIEVISNIASDLSEILNEEISLFASNKSNQKRIKSDIDYESDSSFTYAKSEIGKPYVITDSKGIPYVVSSTDIPYVYGCNINTLDPLDSRMGYKSGNAPQNKKSCYNISQQMKRHYNDNMDRFDRYP